MYRRIAERLLENVGYALSAVVSLDEQGRVTDVRLFDTMWPLEQIGAEENAAGIWLISNHPDGCETPYEADLINLVRLSETGKTVHLFLCSTYFACRKVTVWPGRQTVP